MSEDNKNNFSISEFEPNREVYMSLIFNHGSTLTLRTIEKRAQESLIMWKRAQLFYTMPVEQQKEVPESDRPWYLYHFLIGDESKPETVRSAASVILPSILGISYYPVPPEDKTHEHMMKANIDMMNEFKKFLRNEIKDEAWKNPPCDHEHKENE